MYGGVNVPINPHESIPDDAEVKDSKIVKEDGEYYAHLSIKQRVELQDEYNGVLAVDLGSRWVAVSVALPSRETTFYGEEIRQLRRHHQELRTRLQEKGAYDTLVSAKDSEWRAIDDRLHRISRQIVEDAKERNALIVIGNLEGIQNQNKGSEMNRRLQSMPHYTLTQYIEYKARFAGIGVKMVNEYNTSRAGGVVKKRTRSGSVKVGISVMSVGWTITLTRTVRRTLERKDWVRTFRARYPVSGACMNRHLNWATMTRPLHRFVYVSETTQKSHP